jgi:hypothetical protein
MVESLATSPAGSFYAKLTPFTDFVGLNDGDHYEAAPADWWVVITDVKGSTKAIEEGRYKDVNLVGAATIACVANVLGDMAFPFVFGGDGATAVIPGEHKEAVAAELNALRRMSTDGFGMGLRVGFVSVSQLNDEGLPVWVAKYALNPSLSIAMFQGGALTRAEELVKGDEGRYGLEELGETSTDLSALSCSWKPIQAKHGEVLSLLVQARGEDPASVYADYLRSLETLFVNGVDEANPAHVETLEFKGVGALLNNDNRLSVGLWSRFKRYAFTFFLGFLVSTRLIHRLKSMRTYIKQKRSHSDYRKFDDVLRMTVDCTPEQLAGVRALCQEQAGLGRIYYGTHVSQEALMTCFVQKLSDGQHIHFIDGGGGGYAMAAKQLKSQIRDGKPSSLVQESGGD